MKNIQVFTDSFAALNGRSSQRFINPNIDLLTKKESFLNKDWVLPLNDEIKGFNFLCLFLIINLYKTTVKGKFQ